MASAVGNKSSGSDCSLIIDSGASYHMTYNLQLLHSFHLFIIPKNVTIANGVNLRVLGEGTVQLTEKLSLFNVLYVPRLNFNLISIS